MNAKEKAEQERAEAEAAARENSDQTGANASEPDALSNTNPNTGTTDPVQPPADAGGIPTTPSGDPPPATPAVPDQETLKEKATNQKPVVLNKADQQKVTDALDQLAEATERVQRGVPKVVNVLAPLTKRELSEKERITEMRDKSKDAPPPPNMQHLLPGVAEAIDRRLETNDLSNDLLRDVRSLEVEAARRLEAARTYLDTRNSGFPASENVANAIKAIGIAQKLLGIAPVELLTE